MTTYRATDPAVRTLSLRSYVRHALRLTTPLLAGSIVWSHAALAEQPFPAVFELRTLNGKNGFIVNGIDERDVSGNLLATGGDVNGDGIDDLIVSGPGGDATGDEDAGEVYVLFGGVGIGSSGPIELALLDGSNGFVLHGIDPEDLAGTGIGGNADFDDDGFDDVIIGAVTATPNQRTRAGQAYVVFGGPGIGTGGSFELDSLDGTNGFTMDGVHLYGNAGESVSAAGDMNDDGYDDVVIGADWADPGDRHDAGQAYVVFGRPRAETPPTLPLIPLGGSDGFILNGIARYDNLGRSVAAAGDVNGDGIADIVIGALHATVGGHSNAGAAYVIFGGHGPFPQLEMTDLDGSNGFAIECHDTTSGALCGISVSGAGDVNGDGFHDVIVGAMSGNPHGLSDAGKTYVLFGGFEVGHEGVVDVSTFDGTNGFVLYGIAEGDQSGWHVNRAGDVNADGLDDLIIGAHEADPGGRGNAGQAYVVYGREDIGGNGVIELASLNGGNGFRINGIDRYDAAGLGVSAAGDLNADGIDDIAIGALFADPHGLSSAGETYVIFGRAVDGDDDGIPDREDNCSERENPDQWDTNGDGYGNACDPDLDDSGVVNFADLGLLKSVFFTADEHADFDGNGTVNFVDLGMMKSLFFRPPGPSGLIP